MRGPRQPLMVVMRLRRPACSLEITFPHWMYYFHLGRNISTLDVTLSPLTYYFNLGRIISTLHVSYPPRACQWHPVSALVPHGLTLYVSSIRSESRIRPPLRASSTLSELPAVVANSRPVGTRRARSECRPVWTDRTDSRPCRDVERWWKYW